MHSITYAVEIEDAAGNEPIEGIVIAPFSPYQHDPQHSDHVKTGAVLAWSEARPMLDYAYDSGFGSQDCHAIWAWTASRVLALSEYDGSTRIFSLPRNPAAGAPETI